VAAGNAIEVHEVSAFEGGPTDSERPPISLQIWFNVKSQSVVVLNRWE
jgi:hypothetical protein